jgi:hypothetical protein|tara:strand:+ start:8136 stop:8489 length:354 start_codon:yes stop_codon:yes gene_type:complete
MAFNSLHTALEAAVNVLLASGLCAEINLVMSPNYTVEANRIQAAEYRVECVEPYETLSVPMVVTFTPPLTREDGSVLRLEEIVGYEVEFDGMCVRGWSLTAESRSSEAAISCIGGSE